MSKHQVIVGNIGTVYDGPNLKAAESSYLDYVHLSKSDLGGRASGEDVTWMVDGEPSREYEGKPPDQVQGALDYRGVFPVGPGKRKVGLLELRTCLYMKRWMRELCPNWTKEEHIAQAQIALKTYQLNQKAYNALVDSEFHKIFGREYKITDYKISGIVREEFQDLIKTMLRALCHQSSLYARATMTHAMLGGRTEANARRLLRETS